MDIIYYQDESVAKAYIEQAILNQNLSIIDDVFLDDRVHFCEFGYTACNSGIKTNLEHWQQIFMPSSFIVTSKLMTESSITYGFLETSAHIGTFKSINATNKKVECKGEISFNFSENKVKKLFVRRAISDILMQLVDYDEDKHSKLALEPMMPFPYEMPLNIIENQLKSQGINLTSPQVKCLCVWLMLKDQSEISTLTQLKGPEIDACIKAIQEIFDCKNQSDLFTAKQLTSINSLISEAFHLILLSSKANVDTVFWPDHIIGKNIEHNAY